MKIIPILSEGISLNIFTVASQRLIQSGVSMSDVGISVNVITCETSSHTCTNTRDSKMTPNKVRVNITMLYEQHFIFYNAKTSLD